MELPKIASREEWLAARLALLAKEKQLSRAQAALAAERRALPMVEITKDYVFTGPDTYSTYGVGADVMLSTYRFLDLTPAGRQRYINQWPWHDTYGGASPIAHAASTDG